MVRTQNGGSRELKNSDLDECHGADLGDGLGYRYFVNGEFPYSVGCFRGQPVGSQPQSCGKSLSLLPAQPHMHRLPLHPELAENIAPDGGLGSDIIVVRLKPLNNSWVQEGS